MLHFGNYRKILKRSVVDKKHIIIIEGNGWGNNYNGLIRFGIIIWSSVS
jgi:hypothetical protein